MGQSSLQDPSIKVIALINWIRKVSILRSIQIKEKIDRFSTVFAFSMPNQSVLEREELESRGKQHGRNSGNIQRGVHLVAESHELASRPRRTLHPPRYLSPVIIFATSQPASQPTTPDDSSPLCFLNTCAAKRCLTRIFQKLSPLKIRIRAKNIDIYFEFEWKENYRFLSSRGDNRRILSPFVLEKWNRVERMANGEEINTRLYKRISQNKKKRKKERLH